MEQSDVAEQLDTSDKPRVSSKWYHRVLDFANVFKSFVGTNYLGVAYAFMQSGLGLGIAGIVLLAWLTDHCCHLLVKCKYLWIDDLCAKCSYHYEHKKETGSVAVEKTQRLREDLVANIDYADLGKLSFGKCGPWIINFCVIVTQVGFCTNYFTFIGNTMYSLFPEHPINQTDTVSNLSSSNLIQTDHVLGNESLFQSSAPPLALLVLSPLAFFVLLTFIQSMRALGVISVIANMCAAFGFFAVFIFILIDFEVSSTFVWASWATLPVFLGQTASSYEAVGTILPIEASMEGNWQNFSSYLHGAIGLLSGWFGVLGIIGYLRYGSSAKQILVHNLPADNPVVITLDVLLMIGILFTFPLQVYPIIQILEGRLFGITGAPQDSTADEKHPLLNKEESYTTSVGKRVPESVAWWKRYMLRTIVTLLIGGLSVLLRNVFAYTSAFVGSLGSCPLAYVIPCSIHLRLQWTVLTWPVIAKDIAIIVFGAVTSIVGVIIALQQIILRA